MNINYKFLYRHVFSSLYYLPWNRIAESYDSFIFNFLFFLGGGLQCTAAWCGISISRLGIEPRLQCWKHWVLTTRSLGNSHHCSEVRCTGQNSAENDPRLRLKDAFQNHTIQLSHQGSCCLHKGKLLIQGAALSWSLRLQPFQQFYELSISFMISLCLG